MTDEEKLKALQQILQGANVQQVNLGDGVQNFYYNEGGKSIIVAEDAEVVNEVNPKREKSVLTSPEAMKIWKKLQRKGWIDENLMPVKGLSKPKAAMIASVITDVLHTEPRWSAIEKLWGIPNLANQLSRAVVANYYNDFLKEIEDAIK